MAHRLNTKKDGTAAFVAVGEKAWHGLGTYVDKAMTAEQAITLGGLDWEVKKRKISVAGGKVIPNVMATVRMDTGDALGIVSDKYQVVQNREAFGFLDSIIDKDEAIFQTAGAIGVGEQIFITCKLPNDILVRGEKVEKYLLLSSGHDGKIPITVGFTSIRVVCWNTLSAALKGLANKFTVLHFANAHEKLDQAAKILGLTTAYSMELDKKFNEMAKVKINKDQLKKFIEECLMPEQVSKEDLQKEHTALFTKKLDSIMEFATTHETQLTDSTKGTLFGAYNAISGYLGHIKTYKTQEEKMKDIMFKSGNKLVEKAFDLSLSMM